jgi:hypothetical protein
MSSWVGLAPSPTHEARDRGTQVRKSVIQPGSVCSEPPGILAQGSSYQVETQNAGRQETQEGADKDADQPARGVVVDLVEELVGPARDCLLSGPASSKTSR